MRGSGAGCTRTCPVGGAAGDVIRVYHHLFRPADILHTVEARTTPRLPAVRALRNVV